MSLSRTGIKTSAGSRCHSESRISLSASAARTGFLAKDEAAAGHPRFRFLQFGHVDHLHLETLALEQRDRFRKTCRDNDSIVYGKCIRTCRFLIRNINQLKSSKWLQ